MTVNIASGIAPLDDRTEGLEQGGLHLLSAPPDPARTAAVVQFVAAALEDGDRAALVSPTPPERLFAASRRFGRPLEAAWREGRLRLVGFRGEHEARLRRAGSPAEVYRELEGLLDPLPGRIAFDPGTALWEGRGDGSAAGALLDFLEAVPATALATTTADLGGELPLSAELVAQSAAGIFQLREAGGGLLRLVIQELDGGRPEQAEVTLALREGEGLAAPDEVPGRRWSDRPGADRDAVLHLPLEERLSEEAEAWLRERYDVTGVEEPLDLVARLQTDEPFGLVLLSLTRRRLGAGRRACRVCRRLRPELPVVVVSEEAFRASDRADLLRDGAEECMTGGVNVEELASRLELARTRVRRPPSDAEAETVGAAELAHAAGTGRGDGQGGGNGDGQGPGPGAERENGAAGALDEGSFRERLRERMRTAEPRVFSLVRFRGTEEDGGLARRLSEVIRAEEGDFAGLLGQEPAVCLADTVPSEAGAFVRRVRESLRTGADGPAVEAEVLGSARDAARLRELTG